MRNNFIPSLLAKTTVLRAFVLIFIIPMTVIISAASRLDFKDSFVEHHEVKLGNQIWMAKNLDVGTFRNGDPIPEAKTKEEWVKACQAKQPAWCYYNNDAQLGKTYGRMYNWYAVNDPRGLSPVGWHAPSLTEWIEFEKFLESAGTAVLFDCNDKLTGFCTKGGGYRFSNGLFTGLGEFTYFSGSTDEVTNDSNGIPGPVLWGRGIQIVDKTHMRCGLGMDFGLYLRCIKN